MLDWLKSCRERGIRVVGQGLTTDAGFTFTFEDWNLFDDSAGLVRGHDRHARGAAGQARRPGAPRGAARASCRSPRPGRCRRSPSSDRKLEKNKKWLDHTLAHAGEKMGKHPVDVMLDMAVEEDLETEFFAAPPNGKIEHLKELVDDPYVLFGVSDGGAHTKFLTAGRYPTETLCKVVREHKMLTWRRRTGGCRRCRPRSRASAAAAC